MNHADISVLVDKVCYVLGTVLGNTPKYLAMFQQPEGQPCLVEELKDIRNALTDAATLVNRDGHKIVGELVQAIEWSVTAREKSLPPIVAEASLANEVVMIDKGKKWLNGE